MKLLYFFTILTLLLTGCGGGGSSKGSKPSVAPTGNISISREGQLSSSEGIEAESLEQLRNQDVSILGIWDAREGESCPYTWTFTEDDRFSIKHGDLVIEGQYQIGQATERDDLYKVYLTADYDNGLADCEGVRFAQGLLVIGEPSSMFMGFTGESIQIYSISDNTKINAEWPHLDEDLDFSGNQSNITPVSVNDIPIIGTWIYNNNESDELCSQKWSYNSDNTFSVSWGELIIQGTYEVNAITDSPGLYKIIMTAKSDNGKTNCEDEHFSSNVFVINDSTHMIMSFAEDVIQIHSLDDNSIIRRVWARTDSDPNTSAPNSTGNQPIAEILTSSRWDKTSESNGCVESFTFTPSGNFTVSSLDNHFSGTYQVGAVTGNNRYPLDMTILQDNALSNCNGDSIDGTGDRISIFIKIQNENLLLFSNSTTTEHSAPYLPSEL